MIPVTRLAVADCSLGSTELSSVNATTATMMPPSQPNKKPRLVLRARGESSMRIVAIMGIGLIATPSASGRMSPIMFMSPILLARCVRRSAAGALAIEIH